MWRTDGPADLVPWAAWLAVALVGSYELLMVIIRSAQAAAGLETGSATSGAPDGDRLQAQVAEVFAHEVAAGRVPSVRTIRARLHVGSHARSGYAHTWQGYQRVEAPRVSTRPTQRFQRTSNRLIWVTQWSAAQVLWCPPNSLPGWPPKAGALTASG